MANGAPIKLTVIGGGSSSFVPALVRKLIGSELLGDVQLTLMDINEQRVRTMEELAKKLVASSGSSLQVSATLDRRESLRDADYVITTIAAGGMDAWEKDIEIPAKYGIVMHVADSIGPGGIMRALRNAPVIAARCSATSWRSRPTRWCSTTPTPRASERWRLRPCPRSGRCRCARAPRSRLIRAGWAGTSAWSRTRS